MNPQKISRHFRRFEFKYLIEKEIADILIPQLMTHMEWDPFVGEKEYYECHSLYCDTPALKCYHEKIDGLLNRKKVRIRSYKRAYNDKDILFFELKRKSGDIVIKDREVLPGASLKKFFENPFSLLDHKNIDTNFLNEFIYEYTRYSMIPKVLVSYKRKPFFSKTDSSFRVTFDYDLEFGIAHQEKFNLEYKKMHENFVVMEVKFNGPMPEWFHKIINTYRLHKEESCKYCFGVDLLYGEPTYS